MGPASESFFEFTSQALRWEEAFLVLAVRSGRSVLLRAGVPKTIARSPDLAADRAMTFLLAFKDLPLKAGAEAEYRAAVESLVRVTFEELSTALGPEVTEQLREWLIRNFVDHGERMRLWIWSRLLPHLAGAYGTTAKTPPPLSNARMQGFNDIVLSHFGPKIDQDDADLAERARLEPLSLLEQELVALQVTDPGDPDKADVIDSLMEAAGNERARKAWDEIDKGFTPRERMKLVSWRVKRAPSGKCPLI